MTKSYAILKRARISMKKFRQILKYFSLDIEATKIAQLTGLNRNTVNKYLLLIRKRMTEECELESPFSGDIEVDESFFGARRVKGKRGRGASGKTIVFGLLKRNGKVYTRIVPNCSRATLQAVIQGKVDLKARSTPMGGKAMTAWLTWVIKSIIGFNMATTNLQIVSPILTASKTSGASLKCVWPSSEGFLNLLFICILKSVSLGSIIEVKTCINYY